MIFPNSCAPIYDNFGELRNETAEILTPSFNNEATLIRVLENI